jgi:ribosome-associated translation inhibitor RaiA
LHHGKVKLQIDRSEIIARSARISDNSFECNLGGPEDSLTRKPTLWKSWNFLTVVFFCPPGCPVHRPIQEMTMQVQVNTDNHIRGSEEFTAKIEAVVTGTLSRFTDRITRIEVHLTDESGSAKSRGNDMRCVLETRLTGLAPTTVTADSSSAEHALHDAVEKLERALSRILDRQSDPKGRTSFAGDRASFVRDATE